MLIVVLHFPIPGTNAFDVLMNDSSLMGQCSLPSCSLIEPKNRKDVLRNDVIDHLSELGVKSDTLNSLSIVYVLMVSVLFHK